jgi:hypothetical protein
MDFSGRRVIIRPQEAVPHAVEQLFRSLSRDQPRKLKIRSGEHLAAILTTVFLYIPPVGIDDDSCTDLHFDGLPDNGGGVRDLLGNALTAAFEVKSMAGGFLEMEAALSRDLVRGITQDRKHEVKLGLLPQSSLRLVL